MSPVVTPLDPATGLASQPLWVPPGTAWLERATGLLRVGGGARAPPPPPTASASSSCGAAPAAWAVDCATSERFSADECAARGCCWRGGDAAAANNTVGGRVSSAPQCAMPAEVVGALVVKKADLAEVPTLVRAGAILAEFPRADDKDTIGQSHTYMRAVFTCLPSGRCHVYSGQPVK